MKHTWKSKIREKEKKTERIKSYEQNEREREQKKWREELSEGFYRCRAGVLIFCQKPRICIFIPNHSLAVVIYWNHFPQTQQSISAWINCLQTSDQNQSRNNNQSNKQR